MIAEVVPVKRAPIGLPFFDYEIPPELEKLISPGSLVIIPLRAKDDYGVVLTIKKESASKKIKPIKNIVLNSPVLSEATLKYLREVSEIYATSLGLLVKTALFPLKKRKMLALQNMAVNFPETPEFPRPRLFTSLSEIELLNEINGIAAASTGQTLVIFPELKHLDSFIHSLGNGDATLLTGELGDKKIYDSLTAIWRGTTKLIIGTRRALFAPFNNLQNIIIFNEAGAGHKSWDAAPRVHSLDAGLILAKTHGARLHIITPSPSVETFYFARAKTYDAPGGFLPKPKHNFEIIDLHSAPKSGNRLITTETIAAIKNSAAGETFVLAPRQGHSTVINCHDCHHFFNCPTCGTHLIYHEKEGKIICHHCNYQEEVPANCPACGGVNLKMFGVGDESLAMEIKKLLPDKKITILRSEDEEEKPIDGDIIIGTEQSFSRIDWSKIKTFVFAYPDLVFYIPEFRVREELWALLMDVSRRLPTTARIIVQTYDPQNLLFGALANYELFYNEELKARQFFGYPPFRYLLRLYHSDPNRLFLARESQEFAKKLRNLTESDKNITIMPEAEAFPAYQKGQYWRIILLKIGYEKYKQTIKKINKIAPTGWKIDPNPRSILTF